MCTATPASRTLLPSELSSAAAARRFVARHWCSTHDSAQPGQVSLLVTELVTNAVRHGGPPVLLTVDCVETRGVVVSVSDGSDEIPTWNVVDPLAVGGRGVWLVQLVSVEWGVERHPRAAATSGDPGEFEFDGGKTVWCRLVA